MSLEVVDIAPEHAAGLADLHMRGFPDAFLTRLGRRFLERFYAEFATSPDGMGTVAIQDGRVVGFLVGTRTSPSFFGSFYRRHPLAVAIAVARAVARDPAARRHAATRASHLRYLVPGRARPAAAAGSAIPARMLSMAVSPDVRGGGIGEAILDHYRASAKAMGIDRLGFSVRHDNPRAQRFFRRTGWEVERETEDGVYFHRSTG